MQNIMRISIFLCYIALITLCIAEDLETPIHIDDDDKLVDKRASWLDIKRDLPENLGQKRASWLEMKPEFNPKRASFLDMKRFGDKRASFLDMKRADDKRASFLDMKRADDKRASFLDMKKKASFLDMKRSEKRASFLDMKRADDKRASFLDMKRAAWLDMKRNAGGYNDNADSSKRAAWLDMKRASWLDIKRKDEVKDVRREAELLKELYDRAVEKGKLNNEGLKLLREMLLRNEVMSPSAMRQLMEKLSQIKEYRQAHAQ